jgi:hypothetical protein
MRLSLLQRLEDAHDDSVWAAAWAPNSNTLVTGSVDESVKLWQESGDTLEQQHHLVSIHAALSVTPAPRALSTCRSPVLALMLAAAGGLVAWRAGGQRGQQRAVRCGQQPGQLCDSVEHGRLLHRWVGGAAAPVAALVLLSSLW